VEAFSAGIGFDPSALQLLDVTPGTAALAPDYFQPAIDNAKGWSTAGIILDDGQPGRTIPAGDALPVLAYRFSIACSASAPAVLRFEDGHQPAALPVRNLLSVAGNEIVPDTLNGSVTPLAASLLAAASCVEGGVAIEWSLGGCMPCFDKVEVRRGTVLLGAYSPEDGYSVDPSPQEGVSYRVTAVDRCGRTYSATAQAEPCGGDRFVRGDVNADATTTITDPISLLGFLFLDGAAPPCPDAADVDDDGTLNITDPIALLGFLFLGAKAPPAPLGGCGPDPQGLSLGPCDFAPCR
jgi:hypothetical protein